MLGVPVEVRLVTRPEVTKRRDFTHKRQTTNSGGLASGIGALPRAGATEAAAIECADAVDKVPILPQHPYLRAHTTMCFSQVRSQASGVAGTINVFRDQDNSEKIYSRGVLLPVVQTSRPGLLTGSQQACSRTCSADAG